jgi:hypothetical protein
MTSLTLSPLTRAQWVSVLKNALISGLAAFVTAWSASNYSTDKSVLVASATAGLTAIIKVIEKLK